MEKMIKRLALFLTLALFAANVIGCSAEDVDHAISTTSEIVDILSDTETEEAADSSSYEYESAYDTETDDVYVSGDEGAEASDDDAVSDADDEELLDPDGSYDSKEDVALYLHEYGELPSNYITKKEAQDLGWSGGSVEQYAEGKCIGGSKYGNYEGILPDGSYHECDIDTLGKSSRGAKRIVYSTDGNIYYTDDHYETFTLLYTADGPSDGSVVYK